MGICDIEYNWFTSYLTSRKQLVRIDNCESTAKEVTVGVPQGSLLSVLLFKLFVNDMHKSLKFSTGILYADDTTIFIISKSVRFLITKMQFKLNSISHWLKLNRLKVNVKKTKSVLFNREGLSPNIHLEIDDEEIEAVKEYKLLGIHLDS